MPPTSRSIPEGIPLATASTRLAIDELRVTPLEAIDGAPVVDLEPVLRGEVARWKTPNRLRPAVSRAMVVSYAFTRSVRLEPIPERPPATKG